MPLAGTLFQAPSFRTQCQEMLGGEESGGVSIGALPGAACGRRAAAREAVRACGFSEIGVGCGPLLPAAVEPVSSACHPFPTPFLAAGT